MTKSQIGSQQRDRTAGNSGYSLFPCWRMKNRSRYRILDWLSCLPPFCRGRKLVITPPNGGAFFDPNSACNSTDGLSVPACRVSIRLGDRKIDHSFSETPKTRATYDC